MEERIEFYYNSQIDTPWCNLKTIQAKLKTLSEAGIPVTTVDTASMDERQLYEHYTIATYPSVRKQYRIRQIFGSQNKSGQYFGRKQPALLVYQADSNHPIDIYPHDENGTRIGIEDFLEEKMKALKIEGDAIEKTYEILDAFICSVEEISEKYAYLTLRNQDKEEERERCLEYPLEALEKEVGEVSEGTFLRCEIREFVGDSLSFHFEISKPKTLSLAERQVLLERYRELLSEDASSQTE